MPKKPLNLTPEQKRKRFNAYRRKRYALAKLKGEAIPIGKKDKFPKFF